MNLKNYVKLSRLTGQRMDLVQAGGGNSSVKPAPGKMVIKASGGLLADVREDAGWVLVDNNAVIKVLETEIATPSPRSREHNAIIAEKISATVIKGTARPSIEIFLHSLFSTYTIHTHPIAVVSLALHKSWQGLCEAVARETGEDAVFIPYATPGIGLAMNLYSTLQKRGANVPKIAFLQKHGLITSSKCPDEAMELTNAVNQIAAKHTGMDFGPVEEADSLAKFLYELGDINVCVRKFTNGMVIDALRRNPTLLDCLPCCPDTLIYCGYKVVRMNSKNQTEMIEQYIDQYGILPNVIAVEDRIYFVASTLRKTMETEDVFVGHILSLPAAGGFECRLSDDELHFLGNWEAEKYRQKC